ncbi:hypothetical protein LXL04_036403 [Taraxacum kok-saghyz]
MQEYERTWSDIKNKLPHFTFKLSQHKSSLLSLASSRLTTALPISAHIFSPFHLLHRCFFHHCRTLTVAPETSGYRFFHHCWSFTLTTVSPPSVGVLLPQTVMMKQDVWQHMRYVIMKWSGHDKFHNKKEVMAVMTVEKAMSIESLKTPATATRTVILMTNLSLPPLMNLVLGEPGSGGSSTLSVVGAVKKWEKFDLEKSTETWNKLSDANCELEKQLNLLSKLAEENWDSYKTVVDSCSVLKSQKWEGQFSKTWDVEIVKALLGARDVMLNIRSQMRQMGEAAGIPVSSFVFFLNGNFTLEHNHHLIVYISCN